MRPAVPTRADVSWRKRRSQVLRPHQALEQTACAKYGCYRTFCGSQMMDPGGTAPRLKAPNGLTAGSCRDVPALTHFPGSPERVAGGFLFEG